MRAAPRCSRPRAQAPDEERAPGVATQEPSIVERGDSLASGTSLITKFLRQFQSRLGGARVPAAGTRGAVSRAGVRPAGVPAALLPVPGLLHGAAVLQPDVSSAGAAGSARAGPEALPGEAARSSAASGRLERLPAPTKRAPGVAAGGAAVEQPGEQLVH